jgi:hypothetical protein
MKKYSLLILILFICGCGTTYNLAKSYMELEKIDSKYNISSLSSEEELNNLLNDYNSLKVDLTGKKDSQMIIDLIDIKEIFIKAYYESQQYSMLLEGKDICANPEIFDDANAHMDKTIFYFNESRIKIDSFEKNYSEFLNGNDFLKENFKNMEDSVSEDKVNELNSQVETNKKNFAMICKINSQGV